MKRKGFLFDKIIDKENIRQAILFASKGKTKRKVVIKTFENIDHNIDYIHNLLKTKSYIPSPYIKSSLIDGASKKERIIYKPKFFPDQIIHWSLINIIKPLLMRGMYQWNCASIQNRGTLYAKNAVEKWVRNDHKNTRYVLKVDIKKYYPSIDKEKLKQKFRKIIKDKDTLWLIDTIIDSHDIGIPIGNYTSQWFANFYLQDIDHFIKEKLGVKYYVRYMDDMVLFSANKKHLRHVKIQLEQQINNESLTIKSNWQMFPIDKRTLDFIGYSFNRNKTFVRKRITNRMRKKFYKFKKHKSKHNAAGMISYLGWLKHSDSFVLYKKYYNQLKLMKKIIRGG